MEASMRRGVEVGGQEARMGRSGIGGFCSTVEGRVFWFGLACSVAD